MKRYNFYEFDETNINLTKHWRHHLEELEKITDADRDRLTEEQMKEWRDNHEVARLISDAIYAANRVQKQFKPGTAMKKKLDNMKVYFGSAHNHINDPQFKAFMSAETDPLEIDKDNVAHWQAVLFEKANGELIFRFVVSHYNKGKLVKSKITHYEEFDSREDFIREVKGGGNSTVTDGYFTVLVYIKEDIIEKYHLS